MKPKKKILIAVFACVAVCAAVVAGVAVGTESRAGHYRLIKWAHVDGLESRPSAPAPDLLVAEFDIQ